MAAARARGADGEGAEVRIDRSSPADAAPTVEQPSDDPHRTTPQLIAPAPVLMVMGAVFLALADRLTEALTNVLPAAAEVSSVCCRFPDFQTAFPYTLRALGLALIVSGAIWLLCARVPSLQQARIRTRALPTIALVALVGTAFALYAWVSYPHNGGQGDAHLQWTGHLYSRRTDYFYALIKALHIPFYDYPHLVQGFHGAINVLLVVLIGRRLFGTTWLPLLMGASLLISTQLLHMADGSTDVQLSATVLLVVLALYVYRARYGLGAGLFLAFLGRPPFLLFVLAFALAEVLLPGDTDGPQERPWLRRALTNPYLWKNGIVFTVLFAVWNLILILTGMKGLFDGFGFADRPSLAHDPYTIQGFTAYPFSGAHVLHAAWIYPLPVLAANVYAAVRIRALPRHERKVFIATWLFIGGSFFIYEYLVFKGFTIKYITYFVPLIVACAWFAWLLPRPPRWRAAAAGLAALLALAPITTYQSAIAQRNERAASPISQIFLERTSLRARALDYKVVTTIPGRAPRRNIAYAFQRALQEVVVIPRGTIPPDTLVVTLSLKEYEDLPVFWSGDGIYIVGPAP